MAIQFIFGLGSGRCGTGTLAEFLGLQKGIWAKHESGFCPWEKDIVAFYQSIVALLAEATEMRIATVALYWRQYLSEIFRDFLNPKVIVLKRDKKKVVESFASMYRGRNYWSTPGGRNWEGNDTENDPLGAWFPKYDLPKKEAIGKFWEEYYNDGAIDYWLKKFPRNIMLMRSEDLWAGEEAQRTIFEFLEIPEEDMIFDTSIWKHKRPDKRTSFIAVNRKPPERLGELHRMRKHSGVALEYAEIDTGVEVELTPEEFKQIEAQPEMMKALNKEEEANA